MRITISSPDEADSYIEQLKINSEETINRIFDMRLNAGDLFSKLRFEEIGRHPLEDRKLNFVEQLNQTSTFMVSFIAVKKLFHFHPDISKLNLNLGTASGFDIESYDDNYIHAEVFAATSPKSNCKLAKDILRLKEKSKAQHRYVFFYSPEFMEGRCRYLETYDGVQVWAVEI